MVASETNAGTREYVYKKAAPVTGTKPRRDEAGVHCSVYGVSINTYVLNLRITKAKQMLRFTDKKMEDIGYQCGLGAPHYFSRIFKQVEGITPSEFREKW